MRVVEKKARNLDDAITEALVELGITSDQANIEIVDKGVNGILSIFSNRQAIVRVSKKINLIEVAESFLKSIFDKMKLEVSIETDLDENNSMNINLTGPNMGVLIGKRGQTLDSLQYLVSLVVNRKSEVYIRIKLDTENYRLRRKETLEALAANLANKVQKTGKRFTLEPMNPYERRIIHYSLQDNKGVQTHSEGEDPYRKVVISPAKK